MFRKNWRKEILTIPNLLSLFRLALIPAYISIYLRAESDWDYLTAGTILALSCLTDMADGRIARRFHMTSTLGKILDPLADKTTQLALTFCISLKHGIFRPMMMLLVIKEGFQIGAGILALRKGKILPGALMAGKVCTTVLFISLILIVLFPRMTPAGVNVLAALDIGFLMVSFICYILAYYGKNPILQDFPAE